ncbi:N-acylglucosamine 2-epimerase [Xylanimonas cellulosilytica DSM 15894]|uniref:N-acylglucosamine 2-epimerase n=1 Tax=Xylanimonas cellulosilytica (strain DSM 15894 / JCM 12276 / CECT 5975 / KCTC 9989 / LMG 20990 / NBRC 107835 / XIL07) TaxID=446471 RepID=D1BUR7_XYLCX|nr:AGE family epimerase/isomerase [Xylanimonas cellulosilytica]ACZ29308.1 N-acylglucosamine 2-epimerase [Xylanimonas cellulosilytica DSM 15894]
MPAHIPWPHLASHRTWLDDEARRLLAFGSAAALPSTAGTGGGAAYLDGAGRPDPAHGVQTWITARTVHSYSLGHLLGVPGSGAVADAALAGLTGVLHDDAHGGWFHAVSTDGEPDVAAGKSAYDHAFVMLAGASATIAGRPGGADLLAEATAVYLERFWDEETGRPVDTWDVSFTSLDPYRGLNATMHSVEAMLTVADAVPDAEAGAWRERAARAAAFVVELAATHDGRLPEHFGPDWAPDLELNADQPGDQFKPYGATPGHGLEWARLLLHLEAVSPDPALLATAVTLFDRAVADAWAPDGADGFVYTTDWAGAPVVRTRMHWVVTEAIATAAALVERTGDARFARWYATWWDYAARHLIDREDGSWHHELDTANRPAATVWPGKPDVYHALQATLIPRLPLAPTLARALREGLLR